MRETVAATLRVRVVEKDEKTPVNQAGSVLKLLERCGIFGLDGLAEAAEVFERDIPVSSEDFRCELSPVCAA